MMSIKVKICGLSDSAAIEAAISGGADYLGFVFCADSPRTVSIEQARGLFDIPHGSCRRIALLTDAEDSFLESLCAALPLDMLQLHGAETPARCQQIRNRFALPVMKAIGIENADDLEQIKTYEAVCDKILLDAKPPKIKDSKQTGGHGRAFDWSLLKNYQGQKPWMLAGGLRADTLAEAVRITGASGLDVSSGVERTKGVKDPELITEFLRIAKTLASETLNKKA